jgi:UPF0755 protein
VQRGLLGLYLLARLEELQGPAGRSEAPYDLTVEPGQPASQVVSNLRRAEVVEDELLLRVYLRYRGLDTGIEVGEYVLSGAMSYQELAQALQRARPDQVSVTVVEGWRREQIAEALGGARLAFSMEDFLVASSMRPTGYSFTGDLPDPPSLEGFLFPDTYTLDPDTSAVAFVSLMLRNFEGQVDTTMRARFSETGLSLYEAVILASIVEREAVVEEERPLIASVFLNRLAAGMNLEADPTVQYALGQQPDGSWWKAPLTHADLGVDSPFNTYLYPGLPPRPIANPGLSSLRAVAFPAQTTYRYFRALCDGSGRHAFAETFEQHQENACP